MRLCRRTGGHDGEIFSCWPAVPAGATRCCNGTTRCLGSSGRQLGVVKDNRILCPTTSRNHGNVRLIIEIKHIVMNNILKGRIRDFSINDCDSLRDHCFPVAVEFVESHIGSRTLEINETVCEVLPR